MLLAPDPQAIEKAANAATSASNVNLFINDLLYPNLFNT
jgi:hypothetical protein